MYKLYCRLFQAVLRLALPFLPWRRPELLKDNEALAAKIKAAKIAKVIIVTDKLIAQLGLPDKLKDTLEKAGIAYEFFDDTHPNPTIENVESAFSLYKSKGCRGIIAIGGGSSMDCAKALAARAARPHTSISRMRGILKVIKKLPFVTAIPTTAGTGSETTVAAIVVDGKTHEKFAISDPVLIPAYAILDPHLTVGLPPHITAETGIDALVHAVEAYIGYGSTRQTRLDSERAVRLIFANLRKVYADGADIEARRNMQEAAFLGGAAFTRAFVGNIHSLSHALSGMYGTPHGLANAVIMPYVLRDYGASIEKPMRHLAIAAGIGSTADDMLNAIQKLNDDLNIPKGIADLRKEDIPILAKRAAHESNPLYPVPVIYSRKDMERIYSKLL